MLGAIFENLAAGLLFGAVFGLGYYLLIYGLEFGRTLWNIKNGKSEEL